MRVEVAEDRRLHPHLPRLAELEGLLLTEAVPRGFVAKGDEGRLRERHIEDSVRAVQQVRASDVSAVDLGSGAGLPGLVVAIACPSLSVTLVERRQGRAAFLEMAVERLGLVNVDVFAADAEALEIKADLCLARAFGPLPRTWRVARSLLREGGRLVYFAGARFEAGLLPGAQLVDEPRLASTGPLVIMTR